MPEMIKCPFNKTDSFKCHWKYLTATSRICTYSRSNLECCVKCNFGKPTEEDLWERIKELENELQSLRIEMSNYDPFPFCSLSGCEAVSNDCWKTCPNSVYNQARAEGAKDIVDKLKVEIKEALENNYAVRKERVKKCVANKQSIYDDALIRTIDGKIDALQGIDGFIDEISNKTED